MKDKSIKQPWPRSAKITVWVLGVALLATTVSMALLYRETQSLEQMLRPFEENLLNTNLEDISTMVH